MKQRRSLLLLLALLILVVAVWSYTVIVTPQPRTLDQQVYDVSAQLKCPVCQHESVADSSASIAEQMRIVVRQRLQMGQSEQQVLQYFADHYGQQILLTPPQQGINLLAWLVPLAAMLLGLGLVVFILRDWRKLNHPHPARARAQARDDLQLDPELEQYRVQLEKELKEENQLFG